MAPAPIQEKKNYYYYCILKNYSGDIPVISADNLDDKGELTLAYYYLATIIHL